MIAAPPKRETPGGEPGASQDKTVKSNRPRTSGNPSPVNPIPAIAVDDRFEIFGGAKTDFGNVRRLTQSSFEDLVATLPGQQIPITRADFHRRPKADRDQLKRVDYIVAATYKSSPSPRPTVNALKCWVLILDVDDNDEGQRMLATSFDVLLGDLAAVVWHTANSTPDEPRLRIMVRADGIPVSQYAAAVEALGAKLGMSSVNKESKTPVQAMYLPVQFKGESPPEFVYSKPDGRTFDVGNVATLTSTPAPVADQDIANLDNFKGPVEGVTKAEIADALQKVDPDCTRTQWLETGMGLKHQFGDEGFEIWNSWSSEGVKYPGPKAIKKEWDSFVGQTKDRVPVTIRSVIRAAMTGGWIPLNPAWASHRSLVEQCARDDQRGDAQLLAVLAREQFLLDHTAKKWRIYSKGVWELDEVHGVRVRTKPLLAKPYLTFGEKLHAELADDVEAGRVDQKNLKQDPREKLRLLLLGKVARLNRRSHIDDVLNLAGDFLSTRTSDFDLQPNLLNLQNGTLDLHSGHFRNHDPRDKLSKRALVEYQPNAGCPQWLVFLYTIFKGDTAKIEFLRRTLGYTLSGEVNHDFIVFCYGSGGNGKSTVFEVHRAILGDYYMHLPVEALLSQARGQRDSQAAAELVRLHGARFALSSEIPEGRRLNESTVKDITGGDMITARKLYEGPFTFSPTHKLWLVGNHKPDIRGVDDGIWRRIYLLPFDYQFPKSGEPGFLERNAVVRDLLEERSGILNWLLEGYYDLRKNGLNPPPSVKAATADYRDDSDPLGDFLKDVCFIDPTRSCTSASLWDAYVVYCGHEKPACSSKKAFTSALEKRGFKRNRSSSARCIEGLDLVENLL